MLDIYEVKGWSERKIAAQIEILESILLERYRANNPKMEQAQEFVARVDPLAAMRKMRVPAERYQTDSSFNHLVNSIECLLHQAEFTPSDVKEAAMLACILYEERKKWSKTYPPYNAG